MNKEKHKYQCAVRQMLLYRHRWGLKEFQAYIHNPKTYPLWIKLQDDFVLQWRHGNRGEKDNWL